MMRVPPGQGLQPQSEAEGAELGRDARAAGIIATLMGLTNAHQGSRNLQDAVQTGSPLRAAASVGQVGLSALPFSGRLVRAMTSTLPRAAATVAGAGTTAAVADGALVPGAEAQQAPSEEVRQLQIRLRNAGLYKGKIDGVMGRDTLEAKQRHDESERVRMEAESGQARSAAEAAKAQAEAAAAAASTRKTELEAEQLAKAAREREQGTKRLQEGNEGIGAFMLRALQNYGPYAGYLAGGYTGFKGVNKLFARGADRAQAAATRADDMMAAPLTARGVNAAPERVGRVNQFWDEGQRGATPISPFIQVPNPRGGRPTYAPNSAAPSAGQLYQPTMSDRVAPVAVPAGIGAGEATIAHLGFAEPAKRELAEAQAAVAKDPSEANIQRLEAARNQYAIASLAAKLGIGAVAGSSMAGLKSLTGMSRARPNTAPAEAMRGQLVQAMMRAKKKTPAKK